MKSLPMPLVMFEYRDRAGMYVNAYDCGVRNGGVCLLDESSESHRPDWLAYYFTEPLIRLIRAGELG